MQPRWRRASSDAEGRTLIERRLSVRLESDDDLGPGRHRVDSLGEQLPRAREASEAERLFADELEEMRGPVHRRPVGGVEPCVTSASFVNDSSTRVKEEPSAFASVNFEQNRRRCE